MCNSTHPMAVPSPDEGGGLASGMISGCKNFCQITMMQIHRVYPIGDIQNQCPDYVGNGQGFY